MSFLVLVLAGLFLAAPFLSQSLYRDVYRYEQTQIKLDNAGIRLGAADAALLDSIARSNQRVRVLEKAHHAVHACANVPSPAQAECVASDKEIEQWISWIHEGTRLRATWEWVKNEGEAKGALPAMAIRRPGQIPIVEKTCPLCRKKTQWELEENWRKKGVRWHLEYRVGEKGRVELGVELKRRSLSEARVFSYRLHPQ